MQYGTQKASCSQVSLMAKGVVTVGLASLGLATLPSTALAFTLSNTVIYDVIGRQFTITAPTFTSVSSGSFTGNAAVVTPGATLTLTGNYSIASGNTSYCPFCIIQGYTAWLAPAPAASQGFWSGIISGPGSIFSSIGSNPGSFSWTTTAPTTPGTYFIGFASTLDFFFQPNQIGSAGQTPSGVAAIPFQVTVQEGGTQSTSVPEPSLVVGSLMVMTAGFLAKKKLKNSDA